ncbi:MAG: 30S ribosomal protein S2 [Pseudomonadota bacterium]
MPFTSDVKQMLEAGVHFGHQIRKWNPKMRPYIYTQRDGVHIIDLAQTAKQAEAAYNFIADTVAQGNSVLLVGTKKQAVNVIKNEAERAGQFYVCNRWLGGMLTNFKTIKASIDKLDNFTQKKEKGELDKLTKKEALQIERQIAKLENVLGGIKKMTGVPGAVFIVDPTEEKIALLEAKKLGIPVVALADTNADPDGIDYIIVGNDDAIRSVEYFTNMIAQACEEGARRRETSLREEAQRQTEAKARVEKKPVKDQEKKLGTKGRAYIGKKEQDEASKEEVEAFAKVKIEDEKK